MARRPNTRAVATAVSVFLLGLAPRAWAEPVQFGDNAYDLINDTVDWNAAAAGAASMTHLGVTGHLVTITSQAENDFVAGLLQDQGVDRIWLGGSDAAQEGTWQWVVGPEAGTVFWVGDGSGSAPPGVFTNWGGGEPNEAAGGEDNVEFLAGGTWNDQNTGDLRAYIVEYESIPEPTTAAMMLVLGLAVPCHIRRPSVRG